MRNVKIYEELTSKSRKIYTHKSGPVDGSEKLRNFEF